MPIRLESFPRLRHAVDHINSSKYRCTRLRTIKRCTPPHNNSPAPQCLRAEQQLRRSFSLPHLPLAWTTIRSRRHLRGRNPRQTSWFHPSVMESSTRTRGEGRTAFQRTKLPPHRHRRPPAPATVPGRHPTPGFPLQIRVRGRRRRISGTQFRWSIMITRPLSLNNSLNHSRPIVSLPRRSSNQSFLSRLRRQGRTGRGGFPSRGTTRRRRSLPLRLPLLFPLPLRRTTYRRLKLCRQPHRITPHAQGLLPEVTPPLLILLPIILLLRSPLRFHPPPHSTRRMG